MSLVPDLERNRQLERWGEKVRPAVERLVGTGRRRDALSGTRLGHPFHPAAVLGPLACWGGAAVLDLVGGPESRGAARRLTGAGILLAAPALASGAADWLDTRGAEQQVGTAHALTNNAALVLQAGSWLARRQGRFAVGRGLGLAAGAVAGAAGYLGGHLAYRRGVGVDTTAFQSGPEDWTRLDASPAPPDGSPVAAVAGDVVLVVVRRPGGSAPQVLEDRCTHRGGPLHQGTVSGSCIVCPWHGSRFDLETGAVAAGPATAPQPHYECRVVEGGLEVRRQEAGGLRRNTTGPGDL